jgi:hypothetical protein
MDPGEPLRLVHALRMVTASVSAAAAGTARMIMGGHERLVELKPGDVAPDFDLEASDGRRYRLSDLRGHAVVVAWFPKAFTGG